MKIFVIGASGSGTSTLGIGLSRQLKIAHADSDDFFWKDTDPPFTSSRSAETMHSLFYDFVSQEHFVLSGDVLNWGLPEQDILNAFSHVFFLYVPWKNREERLRRREFGRFGNRILQGGDMHEKHEAFIEWASHYESGLLPGRNKKSQMEFLIKAKDNGIYVLEISGLLTAENVLTECASFLARTSA